MHSYFLLVFDISMLPSCRILFTTLHDLIAFSIFLLRNGRLIQTEMISVAFAY